MLMEAEDTAGSCFTRGSSRASASSCPSIERPRPPSPLRREFGLKGGASIRSRPGTPVRTMSTSEEAHARPVAREPKQRTIELGHSELASAWMRWRSGCAAPSTAPTAARATAHRSPQASGPKRASPGPSARAAGRRELQRCTPAASAAGPAAEAAPAEEPRRAAASRGQPSSGCAPSFGVARRGSYCLDRGQ